MNKYFGHFKTITRHKWYVFNACRKSGIFWRGITHDLSKFSPIEFFSSAKYFSGEESPIKREKNDKGYSVAWANHKGKNSHHWEYWTDFKKGELYCVKMPINDLKELLCDWIGAGKAYDKVKWSENEAVLYYNRRKEEMLFHKGTRELLENALQVLLIAGEDAFYTYLRKEFKYV